MGKANKILLAIILILVSAIAFGITWLVISNNNAANTNSKDVGAVNLDYDINKTVIVPIAAEGIVSNLSLGESKEKKVIRVKLNLMAVDKTASTLVTTRESQIIDIVISILRSKTAEEMLKDDAKEVVKKEILQKVNQGLLMGITKEKDRKDKVVDVFFKEFIVQ